MENLSRSRHPNRSKKACGIAAAAAAKSLYDDVYGGPPKSAAARTNLSPRIEDYGEIFGSFQASRASSIPVLDLPAVDEADVFFDVRSSGFDYSEVFGGFEDLDFALSYEDLLDQSKVGHGNSSDDAWSPVEFESMSDESDTSGKDQYFSNGGPQENFNGSTEFSISYHQARQIGNVDDLNETKQVAQIHAVPGFSHVVNSTSQGTDSDNLDLDFTADTMKAKNLKKTKSNSFVGLSEISLRTQPSDVPPPSRPPPAAESKKGYSGKLVRISGDLSPPFFDVEVDASSSAAVSAAAMKDAMEKAQVKLKSAKEIMEKKKGLQSSSKSSSKKSKKEKTAIKVSEVSGAEGLFDPFESDEKDKHVKEWSSGGSYKIDEGSEWKEATEFFELVTTDEPTIEPFQMESGNSCKVNGVKSKEGREALKLKDRERHLNRDVCDSRQNIGEGDISVRAKESKSKSKKALKQKEKEQKVDEIEEQLKLFHENIGKEDRRRQAFNEQMSEKGFKKVSRAENEMKVKKGIEQEENETWLKEILEKVESDRERGNLEDEKRCDGTQEREETEKRIESVAGDAEEAEVNVLDSQLLSKKVLEQVENKQIIKEAVERIEIEVKVDKGTYRLKEENGIGESIENVETPRVTACKKSKDLNAETLSTVSQPEKDGNEIGYVDIILEASIAKETIHLNCSDRDASEDVEIKPNEKEKERERKRMENEKENERLRKIEEEKEQERVRREREMENERLRKIEEEREREREMENGRLRKIEEEKERERARREREMENERLQKIEKEREREREIENERLRKIEEERERERVKRETEKENERLRKIEEERKLERAKREMEMENERLRKIKEEREWEMEMEKERLRKIEEERERERAKRETEKENERLRKIEEERERERARREREMENERLRKIEEEREQERLRREREMENERQRKIEEEREREREMEKERLRKIKEERERERAKREMENERLRKIEEEREREKARREREMENERLRKIEEERQKNQIPSRPEKREDTETERARREREIENERLRKIEEEREREREREKDRMAVDLATLEARERVSGESRALSDKITEARQRAMAEARERLEKACAEAREKSLAGKTAMEARIRAERAAVERATAEARERAAEKLMAERERVQSSVSDKFSASSRNSGMRQSSSSSDLQDVNSQASGVPRYQYSSIYSERYEGGEGESAQRCKARLERHRRTSERAANALVEKNMRDLLAQREQAERNRLAETLDADVRRWSNGKEGNLRALLSTLQYILGSESGWQPIPLTEVITSAAVKKAYRKATLCVHPDKLQQRRANIHHKYVCEKVFDLLKEAWNKFNSEER